MYTAHLSMIPDSAQDEVTTTYAPGAGRASNKKIVGKVQLTYSHQFQAPISSPSSPFSPYPKHPKLYLLQTRMHNQIEALTPSLNPTEKHQDSSRE
jgi:hypothetical protein